MRLSLYFTSPTLIICRFIDDEAEEDNDIDDEYVNNWDEEE